MTRKQRNQTGRNITYDLSNPRNIAAFEALLQDEEDEEGLPNQTSRPSKATRQQQSRKKREKEKFFMLRPGAVADEPTTPQPLSQQDQILQLMELFGGAADKALVSDVYRASGCSMEAATEALFSILGGSPAGGLDYAFLVFNVTCHSCKCMWLRLMRACLTTGGHTTLPSG